MQWRRGRMHDGARLGCSRAAAGGKKTRAEGEKTGRQAQRGRKSAVRDETAMQASDFGFGGDAGQSRGTHSCARGGLGGFVWEKRRGGAQYGGEGQAAFLLWAGDCWCVGACVCVRVRAQRVWVEERPAQPWARGTPYLGTRRRGTSYLAQHARRATATPLGPRQPLPKVDGFRIHGFQHQEYGAWHAAAAGRLRPSLPRLLRPSASTFCLDPLPRAQVPARYRLASCAPRASTLLYKAGTSAAVRPARLVPPSPC